MNFYFVIEFPHVSQASLTSLSLVCLLGMLVPCTKQDGRAATNRILELLLNQMIISAPHDDDGIT